MRLFIPDSPRSAWQAARYWLGIRKSPVKVYGIEDMRRAHRTAVDLRIRLDAAIDKIEAQRAKVAELSREPSELKRRKARD